MIHLPIVLALAVMPMSPQEAAQTTLASLRHDYRPLLIFASSANEEFNQQMQILAGQTPELERRQVLVIPVFPRSGADGKEDMPEALETDVAALEPSESELARRRFHIGPDDFTVILVGKDGGEKLRARTPVTIERLIKLIDSMPARQKELRDGHSG
jgi:hypothetical protein